MKRHLLSLVFIALSLLANSQSNVNVHALIQGYNNNDTIKTADFLKLTEISVNNKEYRIIGFTLLFTDGSSDYEEVSNSNKITDQMKKILSKVRLHDTKPRHIIVKDISVRSSEGKSLKLDNLVYVLK